LERHCALDDPESVKCFLAHHKDARKQLLDARFSIAIDREGKLGETIANKLRKMVSQELFEIIRGKAKDADPIIKANAELLLKSLMPH